MLLFLVVVKISVQMHSLFRSFFLWGHVVEHVMICHDKDLHGMQQQQTRDNIVL